MAHLTFTLRDLLKRPINQHDAAQQEQGKHEPPETIHADDQNIVRPTSQQQAMQARMAKARAAKAQKPRQEPPIPAKADTAKADTLKMPIGATARKVYLTVLTLGYEQMEDGRAPVVAHWRILQAAHEQSIDWEQPARYVLQALEQDGYLRQVITRKGTLCWVPSVLDQSVSTVRGAQSSRGGRTSSIARQVAALEQEFGQHK